MYNNIRFRSNEICDLCGHYEMDCTCPMQDEDMYRTEDINEEGLYYDNEEDFDIQYE